MVVMHLGCRRFRNEFEKLSYKRYFLLIFAVHVVCVCVCVCHSGIQKLWFCIVAV